jgi:hypothetical protein
MKCTGIGLAWKGRISGNGGRRGNRGRVTDFGVMKVGIDLVLLAYDCITRLKQRHEEHGKLEL